MASRRHEKSVDQSTEWSDWIHDPGNNDYYQERVGPTGTREFKYASQSDSRGQASTPRNEYSSSIRSLDRFGSSPQDQDYPSRNAPEYSTTELPTQHGSSPRQRQPSMSSNSAAHLSSRFSTISFAPRPAIANRGSQSYNTPTSPTQFGAAETAGYVHNSRDTYDNIALRGLDTSDHYSSAQNGIPAARHNILSSAPQFNMSALSPDNHGQTLSVPGNTLHKGYKLISTSNLNKFFVPGRVFKTMWTECANELIQSSSGHRNQSRVTVSSQASNFSGAYLGMVPFQKIRRFMVIVKNYGNVLCCPITTYGGHVCNKSSLGDVHKHALIHTSRSGPSEQPGENLRLEPIKVINEAMDKEEGELGILSRVNFSKVYTVEFYQRVLNVGKVHDNHLHFVTVEVPRIWTQPSEPPRQSPNRSGRQPQDSYNSGSLRDYSREPERESAGPSRDDGREQRREPVPSGHRNRERRDSRPTGDNGRDKEKDKDRRRKR